MTPELLVDRLQIAAAAVLLMVGAVSALTSANVAKRLAALLIAQIGALIGLAALGAPNSALMAGIALALAQLMVGVALLVRLQESYGVVELQDFDAADEQSEPSEPAA